MTVVRGAAARRLAVRTHALHLQPPQPGLHTPATSRAAAGAALPSTYQFAAPDSRDGHEGNAEGPGATSEPWSAVLQVATGTSLRHARAFVHSQLRDHGHADRKDDATLIAVELVINALKHTSASTVTLRLSSPPDGVLLIEVTDPDPGCPAMSARSNAQVATRDAGTASAAAGSESGRGLDIVGLLSCWGVNEHPGGKTVSALLEQDACEDSDHDPSDAHAHAPTPAAGRHRRPSRRPRGEPARAPGSGALDRGLQRPSTPRRRRAAPAAARGAERAAAALARRHRHRPSPRQRHPRHRRALRHRERREPAAFRNHRPPARRADRPGQHQPAGRLGPKGRRAPGRCPQRRTTPHLRRGPRQAGALGRDRAARTPPATRRHCHTSSHADRRARGQLGVAPPAAPGLQVQLAEHEP